MISQNSDDISCIPESPSSSIGQHCGERSVENDHDLTLVEQPLDDELGTNIEQSSRPNYPSIETTPRVHSSPIAQEFNCDKLDHLNSSPISLHSPSSHVEMMSSPERSPFPDNLNDFIREDKSISSDTQKYSLQISINSPLVHSSYASPNKFISETMIAKSCLDVAYISPETKTTSFLANSSTTEDKRGEKKYLESQTGTNTSGTKKKHCDKDEDDSLLDIFASFPDSTIEKCLLSTSKQKINDDSCLDINLSILSPEEVDNNEKKRHDEGNIVRQVRQTLVFNAKDQGISKEKVSYQENGSHSCSITIEDVDKPTTKQACNGEKPVDIFFDDSSLEDLVMERHETGLQKNKTITEERNGRSTTSKDVFETPKRQFRSVTRHDDSWMEHSLGLEGSHTKVTRNAQESSHFMTPMGVVETPIKQSTSDDVVIDGSPLQLVGKITPKAQNNEHVVDHDDDEFIDYYDDGGFNCDIDDYFNYDTHCTIEKDDLIPADERPAAKDVNEKTIIEKCEKKVGKVNNNIQTEENKKNDWNKDVEKGESDVAEGKTKKPENEIVCKRTQGMYDKQQEDPKTPMHDYSNMATPELRVQFVLLFCHLFLFIVY